MNNERIKKINEGLRFALSSDNKRYQHSLNVANTSMCMAACHGSNMENAYIAGLLHDNAKCIPYDRQIEMCRNYNIQMSATELDNPYLLHAKLGAFLAKKDYGVNELPILEAIKWHTTGKPCMNTIEKIVFVADYIEPMRHHAPNLELVRKLAFSNLLKCVFTILNDTINMLRERNRPIDENALKAYEYYKTGCAEDL